MCKNYESLLAVDKISAIVKKGAHLWFTV